MAEYCLDCFNKHNGTSYTKNKVTLEEDLCEGCGKVTPCVITLHPPGLIYHIKNWITGRR